MDSSVFRKYVDIIHAAYISQLKEDVDSAPVSQDAQGLPIGYVKTSISVKQGVSEKRAQYSDEYKRPTQYKLIRIVPDLKQIAAGPNGSVYIVRPKHHRQTIHFSINSMMTEHGQGDWTKMPIAIIADMKEMGQPGQINFQDTWYYTDKNNRLNLGHPVILAPTGTQAPQGVKLTYYSGSLQDAVEAQLEKSGIQLLDLHAHGVSTFSNRRNMSDRSIDTRQEVDAALKTYGYDPKTPRGAHFWSPDKDLEDHLTRLKLIRDFINSGADTKTQTFRSIENTDGLSQGNIVAATQSGIKAADATIQRANQVLRGYDLGGQRIPPVTDPRNQVHIQKIIKISQAYKRLFQNIATKNTKSPNPAQQISQAKQLGV